MTAHRFTHEHIERRCVPCTTDRIEMYRDLSNLEHKRAQELSSQGNYAKAFAAEDQAREYREAALLLTEKPWGTGI